MVKEPLAMSIILAGELVSLAIASLSSNTPSSTSFNVKGNSVSSPLMPAALSPKGSSLLSLSSGVWSLTIASIIPIFKPMRNACMSSLLRNGGVT